MGWQPAMRFEHGADHRLHDRHWHAVAGLFARLGVGRNDSVTVGKSLQAEHFARREATFSVHEQIIVGSSGPQRAGPWVSADVTGFVFMPDGGLAPGLKDAPAAIANVIGGVMLAVYFAFEQLRQRFHRRAALRPLEMNSGFVADDEHAFPFLGQAEVEGVQDAILAVVTEVMNGFENALQGLALVMADEKLHIFEHECARFLRVQNARDIKKQSSARVVESAHVTDNAEGLTRKTGEQ